MNPGGGRVAANASATHEALRPLNSWRRMRLRTHEATSAQPAFGGTVGTVGTAPAPAPAMTPAFDPDPAASM